MYKKHKIIMLPEDKVSHITLETKSNKLWKSSHGAFANDGYINQHLYIISDEEIKEGDQFLHNIGEKSIHIYSKIAHKDFLCKEKIIASTNSNLLLPTIDFKDWNGKTRNLLTLSKEFISLYIEEYNKGNIIEEVEVEYEDKLHYENTIYKDSNKQTLKLNSNNEINVKLIKES